MDEVLYNSIWRFLAVREYVDAKHHLTAWGKVLAGAIAGLKGQPDMEAATVVAVELLRLGSLTADVTMFPSYNGAPMRGSSTSAYLTVHNLLLTYHSQGPTIQHARITHRRSRRVAP